MMIVGGEEDAWFPRDALEKMAKRLGARLEILEKVGQ